MATALSQDDLLEAIDKMTVLELSDFIKSSRSATASPPQPPPPSLPPLRPPGGGEAAGAGAAAAEEQTEFSAVLSEVGPETRSRSSRSSVS
jgi:large subunit ribosomal protein L7/L12